MAAVVAIMRRERIHCDHGMRDGRVRRRGGGFAWHGDTLACFCGEVGSVLALA